MCGVTSVRIYRERLIVKVENRKERNKYRKGFESKEKAGG